MTKTTKRNIYLITVYYPYDVGEQFIAAESSKWSQNTDVNLTILPLKKDIRQRKIPKNIYLEPVLIAGLSLKQYFRLVMFAFSNMNKLFYELRFSYTFLRFRGILRSFLKYCLYYVKLENYVKKVVLITISNEIWFEDFISLYFYKSGQQV